MSDFDVSGGAYPLDGVDVLLTGAAAYTLLKASAYAVGAVVNGLVALCSKEPAAVSITRVEPPQRRTHGHAQEVAIVGNGFAVGITVAIQGNAAAVIQRVSDSRLRVNSPGGLQGFVTVSVLNPDGGTAARNDVLEYVPAPAITIVHPPSGPTAGGTAITITGTDFHATATVLIDGVLMPVTGRVGTTVINVTAPPRATGGPRSIYVYNPPNPPANNRSNAGNFIYIAPPNITAIAVTAPRAADAAIGLVVGGERTRLTGTAFDPVATVTVDGVQLAPASIVARGGTTTIDITTPQHAAAAVLVRVTNPDGQYGEIAFTYAEAPVVTAVQITAGPSSAVGTAIADTAGGETAQIDGLRFAADARVTIGGQAAAVADATGVPGRLIVTTPARGVGARPVQVTNANGNGLPSNADVNLTYAQPPTVTSAVVIGGAATNAAVTICAGGETVRITGTRFVAGCTVQIGGAAAAVNNAVIPTRLDVTTPARPAGAQSVVVFNPNGQHTAQAVALTYANPPAVTAVQITAGTASSAVGTAVADVAGGETLRIDGTDFDAGATVAIDGQAAAVTDNTQVPNRLTVTTPARAAGARAVVVRNPNGLGSNTNIALTYAQPPTVTAVTITVGNAAGGAVTVLAGGETARITGTGFDPNATVAIDGAPAAVTDNTGAPAALVVTTPARAAGARAIVVTNPNGQRTAQVVALTYAEPPAITRIDPANFGSTGGGIAQTIVGTGFVATPAVTFGGTAAQAVTFRSATQLDVTTPAHADPEAVDVIVRNPDTLQATAVAGYSYVPPPLVAGIVPAVAPAEGNIDVVIVGRYLAGATVRIGGVLMANAIAAQTSVAFRLPVRAHNLGVATTVNVQVTTGVGQTTVVNGFTWAAKPDKAAVIYPGGHTRSTIPAFNQTNPAVVANDLTTLHEGQDPPTEGTNVVHGRAVEHKHTPGMSGGIFWVVLQDLPRVAQLLDHAVARGPADAPNNYACHLNPLPGGYWFPYHVSPVAHGNALAALFANNQVNAALNATPSVHAVYPPAGPAAGGNEIAILGSELNHTNEVLIGGVSVAPNHTTPNRVTVTVPAHANGAVDIEVRNAIGNGNRLANAYAYQAFTVTSVQPAVVDQNGGETVYILGTGFRDGNIQVQIGGVTQPNPAVHGSTIIEVMLLAHAAAVVNMTVTDTGTGANGIVAVRFR